MSLLNDPQNPNSLPESAPPEPGRNFYPPGHTEDRDSTLPGQTPLPVFDRAKPDDGSLLKTVSGKLPELEAVLRNQPPEAVPAPPQPVYQIKPAESNWAAYPVPSLSNIPPTEEEEEESGSGWQTAWAVTREIGETILLTLIIFVLIQLVIRNFRVVGTSMNDNLQDGQYLIIDKITYSAPVQWLGWGGPRHGDVVVFEPPNHPDEDYVKRIVGLPGETVEVRDGKVWVNGQVLDESFQPKTPSYFVSPLTVPEGHVYVLGDNRNNSNDSHNWGPLPVENIVGRAWLSYWPPDLWGTIPNDAPSQEATLKNFIEELVPHANAEGE